MTENKLTIEILAGYLPYDLKVRIEQSGQCENIILKGITQYDGEEITVWSAYSGYGEKFKKEPYLRPLSQITEEIEHNGESFVPDLKLKALFDAIECFDLDTGDFYVENYSEMAMKHVAVLNMPYAVVAKLLEWHFDVFGLIDQGLALPIEY